MICNISHRQPRGNHAQPRIEGSELAKKRLEGRVAQTVLLVDQADSGGAPGRPEPAKFADGRRVSPIFRPFATLSRSADLDRQIK
jgi:hypothetical protein